MVFGEKKGVPPKQPESTKEVPHKTGTDNQDLPQTSDFVNQIGLSEDWDSDYGVSQRRALWRLLAVQIRFNEDPLDSS
jgi:hypothetical protein